MTDRKKEAKNQIHQDAIHLETIKKELREQRLHTQFGNNPLKKVHVLTEKPMAPKPTDTAECYAEIAESFHKAKQVPAKKYPEPVTESHEIGWSVDPLIQTDRFDRRFNFHRKRTDISGNIFTKTF